jgi:CBS domain-containing protein
VDVLLADAPIAIGERSGQILFLKDAVARGKTEDALARLLAELQSMLPLATRAVKSSELRVAECGWNTPVRRAAEIMSHAKSSAILVKAPDGDPIGIVTDQDLRNRVLAAGAGADTPVSKIMSAPLVRIPSRALLFEAALAMQERGVQHLLVVDDRGAAEGILTGAEILHAQRHALALVLSEIRSAASVEALRESQSKLPAFVKALLESGARTEHVTRIMATVSEAILLRLIELAEAELGPRPQPIRSFSWGARRAASRRWPPIKTTQSFSTMWPRTTPRRFKRTF